jgi:p-aminobenzoyl-glutamate transporter AbgT
VIAITVVWVILFVIMFVLGIPVGPGYPIKL